MVIFPEEIWLQVAASSTIDSIEALAQVSRPSCSSVICVATSVFITDVPRPSHDAQGLYGSLACGRS
jgi:hypothetical protein